MDGSRSLASLHFGYELYQILQTLRKIFVVALAILIYIIEVLQQQWKSIHPIFDLVLPFINRILVLKYFLFAFFSYYIRSRRQVQQNYLFSAVTVFPRIFLRKFQLGIRRPVYLEVGVVNPLTRREYFQVVLKLSFTLNFSTFYSVSPGFLEFLESLISTTM